MENRVVRSATGQRSSHNQDFFNLVGFLAGGGDKARDTRDLTERLFEQLSEELHKGALDSARARQKRDEVLRVLYPLMARTERPRETSDVENLVEVDLLPSDLVEVHRMRECFAAGYESWIVPMWQSVPLPMQALGARYQAWSNAKENLNARPPALDGRARNSFEIASPWPHPRLRALLRQLPERKLALPWIRPSLPWWSLGPGWDDQVSSNQVDGKMLLFSRFRAVPTALSGLVSFALEAALVKKTRALSGKTHDQLAKRRWLQPGEERTALFELFHPSPLLAQLDPLLAPLGDVRRSRTSILRQLKQLVKQQLGLRIEPKVERRMLSPWQLIAALELRAGLWGGSMKAWRQLERADGEGGRLGAMLARWETAAQTEIGSALSETEVIRLAELALESPAVVVSRALRRHWPSPPLDAVVSLCWRGFRSYLDSPWFVASLGSRDEGRYPESIRSAVVEGNLESVLDEHFWYLAAEGTGSWQERVEELEAALKLRDASVTFHEAGPGSAEFRLGCHVAVPLTEARIKPSSEDPHSAGAAPDVDLRPDLVRRAFNSPFWPYVLTTTSVGQEGLDFHPWCRTLAHWDLAPGPVALEQREGRITRFAGMSVRRAVAQQLAPRVAPVVDQTSPWQRLQQAADAELVGDGSGLSPWWIVPGGDGRIASHCRHLLFSIPGSELKERSDALARERALYRLVLGMPDQADLLALLQRDGRKLDPVAVNQACLDLSAYRRGSRAD